MNFSMNFSKKEIEIILRALKGDVEYCYNKKKNAKTLNAEKYWLKEERRTQALVRKIKDLV